MAKDTAAKPWTEGEGPSREQLVAAIRTLISMATCWLDRDAEARGIDRKQLERLDKVMALLAEAATFQREDADDRLLLCFRDDLAIALGAAHRTVPGGHELTERAAKARQDALVVPGGLSTVTTVWANGKVPDDVQRLAHAIEAGLADLRLHGYAGPVADQFSDGIAAEQATALAKAALVHRTRKQFDDAWTPTAAANGIVDQILGRAVKLEARGPRGDTAAEARYGRILARRHADRIVAGRVKVDLGAFFGAHATRSPGRVVDGVAQSRAWAAASIVSEVWDAGLLTADALFEAPAAFFMPWHVWRSSATGIPARPEGHFDLFDLERAVEAYCRGVDVKWPADHAPPLEIAVERATEAVRAVLGNASAIRDGWARHFGADAPWPAELDGLAENKDLAAAIETATVQMFCSPSGSPVTWLTVGAEAITAPFGISAASVEFDQALIIAAACGIILTIARCWSVGHARAVCQVAPVLSQRRAAVDSTSD